jgi:hypothetical protein
MLPKLDEYGTAVSGTKGMKQDRHKLEVFQEYYIDDIDSVKSLFDLLVVNKDFDYLSFMNS